MAVRLSWKRASPARPTHRWTGRLGLATAMALWVAPGLVVAAGIGLEARDVGPDDGFGFAADASRGIAVIGALRSGRRNAGAAYVFESGPSGWTQTAKLEGDSQGGQELFGRAVAVDRTTIVVGAPGYDGATLDDGAAYVFEKDGGQWRRVARLVAPDPRRRERLGAAVAIDGKRIVVGAPGYEDAGEMVGRALVFQRRGSTWVFDAALSPRDGRINDWFGFSVAIDGRAVVVGAPHRDALDFGGAYVFRRVGPARKGTWQQEEVLAPNTLAPMDFFGSSVAIDGAFVAAGADFHWGRAQRSGAVFMFRADTSGRRGAVRWQLLQKLVPGSAQAHDWFGGDIALQKGRLAVGAQGDNGVGSAYFAGAVYQYDFDRAAGLWIETGKHTANRAESGQLGFAVGVGGSSIVAGAPGDGPTGRAYAFPFAQR